MTRLRDESGFTLVELLVASLVSLILLGATLTVLESMMRQHALVERQTASETRAREGADRLAQHLRNLASPADIVTNITASTQPKSVDRNLPGDLVFKDVADTRPAGSLNSANVRRVRYCVQTSGAVPGAGFAASPTRGVLWVQYQTWATAAPPAVPADPACPGTGWTSQRVVADHLVNDSAEPVFRYSGDTGVVVGTTDADRERISRVKATLLVDADPARAPRAVELTTGVVLRNQNRAPIASFVYTLLNPVACSVQLNGSASEDPESKPLEYEWYIDGVKQAEPGVVVQKSVTAGTHTYQLRVYDRARLVGTSPVETRAC
jgi:prepilin-type N-terminal cleavage/methylation domain-containing protein